MQTNEFHCAKTCQNIIKNVFSILNSFRPHSTGCISMPVRQSSKVHGDEYTHKLLAASEEYSIRKRFSFSWPGTCVMMA